MAEQTKGKGKTKREEAKLTKGSHPEKEPQFKRLFKSKRDKVIDGVCGGLGEYLGVDPVFVRVVWVLLVLFGGTGLIAYIVAMIIVPREPNESEPKKESTRRSSDSARLWGAVLLVAGVAFLLAQLGVFHIGFGHLWFLSWHFVWPVLLILAGLYVLTSGFRKPVTTTAERTDKGEIPEAPARQLRRSRTDRKIAGVCAGFGKYFGIDPTIVRVLWVVAAFATGGVAALLYLIMVILLREEEAPAATQ